MKSFSSTTFRGVIAVFIFLFSSSAVNPVLGFTTDPTTLYVAPEPKGNGSGADRENAADFLTTQTWSKVRKALKDGDVKVQFLAGAYLRAYTEQTLEIKNMRQGSHTLTIEGEDGAIFPVPTGHKERGYLINILDCHNLIFRNFAFTGSGRLGYALRISSTDGNTTRNVLVENCSWTDMRGIIYGATGVHRSTTSDVTYRNCVFKRIGIDSHSHHMYHAYRPSNIYVYNSYFEDCTGDYVRFRDRIENGVVRGCVFVRNDDFPVYPFISVPLFSKSRREYFGKHYTFTDNKFTNARFAIAFHHYGFNPPNVNYLLNKQEGAILENGTVDEKKALLKKNFDLDVAHIHISDNVYKDIKEGHVALGSFANYGAQSKGWTGWGVISKLFEE